MAERLAPETTQSLRTELLRTEFLRTEYQRPAFLSEPSAWPASKYLRPNAVIRIHVPDKTKGTKA
jgi:hypothetical protein